MTTALRLFKNFSHTMLRMAKNLNVSQYKYKQRQTKHSCFYFSNEVNNKINPRCLRICGASNSRVFIIYLGVLSKFPKLKTSVFRIAGQRFIRSMRVIRSLSNLCLNCNHCKHHFAHILNSRQHGEKNNFEQFVYKFVIS